ncbi:carboxylesterase [Marinomonas ushuaiensis DSM 15871]|uniref:Carboxylesterase n=1 Tax=Marinomonas ushuaiensis DSM 15871 TaxID=1122207 RepID=X7E268_9GAMM|nr:alpha/beta fold hydrolase [Marinomonas ushuaiensis]ETX09935.1 carboxylesterase [Marinomonas ushuaiensis DSM 15871]
MQQIILFLCLCILALPAFANEKQAEFVFEQDEMFPHYMARAEKYLYEKKLWINEVNKNRELNAVMPFELLPDADVCKEGKRVGVLLSHGLSDSPFSMRDPARALQAACYHVRVILLPGHGTRMEDLLSVSRDDWRDSFRNAADQFSKEVDVLYVGGFSTGGTLAAEYAWNNASAVAGAILFSPSFKINSGIDWLSPWLALVKDWLDFYVSDDFAKYASIPVPAIAEVYKLSKEVRGLILDDPKKLPVYIAMSQDDQTVDSSVTEEVFDGGMIGSNSRMTVYSKEQESGSRERVKVYNTDWPQFRILGLSHMSVHGSPANPYYGEAGEYRICAWHLADEPLYQTCFTDMDNWFGERSDGLLEKSPHAARISWNPDFDLLMQDIVSFMRVNK